MDVQALLESLERLSKKQRASAEAASDAVDSLISELQSAKARIEEGLTLTATPTPTPPPPFPAPSSSAIQGPPAPQVPTHKQVLADLSSRVSEQALTQHLAELQKEVSAAAGKLGKAVDRAFPVDITKAYRDVPADPALLSLEILRHLYREGMLELGDSYAKEAGVEGAAELRARYERLHEIVRQLRGQDAGPALAWAGEHRLEMMLQGGGVHLEFGLHRLQFLHTLTQQGRAAGLLYARQHFGHFAASHMASIQRLMGALLYADRLQDSPYSDLLLHLHWDSMAAQFTTEYYSVLGESARSPLECVLAAGAQAMPMLLKLAALMAAKPGEWASLGQLPVEIELGREFQFHSIFACPVSREPSSADNPPMLLPCCHVLCKGSIAKLAKGTVRPFKCPYCPMETTPSSCRPIQF